MSTETEEKTVLDDLFFNGSYGHINSIVRHYGNHNVLFTDAGKMRLAHIVGHTLGLHHGGQEETALKLAEAIDARLKQLCYNGATTEVTFAEHRGSNIVYTDSVNKAEVPNVKAVLGDDGTFGGFNVSWYRPIAPQRYDEVLQQAQTMKDETPKEEVDKVRVEFYSVQELTHKMLKVTERVNPYETYSDELTQHAYVPGIGSTKVYYTFSHPGGLLYHGPGGGEVFAVTLGDVGPWGIHT